MGYQVHSQCVVALTSIFLWQRKDEQMRTVALKVGNEMIRQRPSFPVFGNIGFDILLGPGFGAVEIIMRVMEAE